jgi:hypothetical protein
LLLFLNLSDETLITVAESIVSCVAASQAVMDSFNNNEQLDERFRIALEVR